MNGTITAICIHQDILIGTYHNNESFLALVSRAAQYVNFRSILINGTVNGKEVCGTCDIATARKLL